MSTIFKIMSTSDYYATTRDQLSFRRGQAFYALSLSENGYYFVSTQYSTPFARNAVCGSVPSHLFTVTDDIQKKAKVSTKAASSSIKAATVDKVLPTTPHTPLTPESDKEPSSASIIMATLVSKTAVSAVASTNMTAYVFNIRVINKRGAKTIQRSFADVAQFHGELKAELGSRKTLLSKLPVLQEEECLDIKEMYRLVYNYITLLFQFDSRRVLDSAASEKFFSSSDASYSTVRAKASTKLFNILGKYYS